MKAAGWSLLDVLEHLEGELARGATRIEIEVLDPDRGKGLYAGERVEIDGTAYIHRPFRVWVDLAVYRRDFGALHVGQRVRIDTDDGVRLDSTIAYISPFGAPETQTMLARAVVDNPDGRLRPGLFVTAEVLLDAIGTVTQVTSRGRYLDRWELRDGRWGIAARHYVEDFTTAQQLAPDEVSPASKASRRDPDDPSYALFSSLR